jgi:hypothetical protein
MTLRVQSIHPSLIDTEVIVVMRGERNAYFSRIFDKEVAKLFQVGHEYHFKFMGVGNDTTTV